MKTAKIGVSAFVLILLITAMASAEESPLYFGTGVGNSALNFNSSDFGTQLPNANRNVKVHDAEYKIFGGYDFSKVLGLEFGYADLGSFNYTVNPTQGYYTGDLFSFKYRVNSLFLMGKPLHHYLKNSIFTEKSDLI